MERLERRARDADKGTGLRRKGCPRDAGLPGMLCRDGAGCSLISGRVEEGGLAAFESEDLAGDGALG